MSNTAFANLVMNMLIAPITLEQAQATTAQARRLYLHVLNGSHVNADDMSRLVRDMERKDRAIQDLQRQLQGM